MSLADWLAAGADPAKMTLEEVRRRQQLCAVREEQTAARLEAQLLERDQIFRRGAATRSAPLRRVLARRWTRLDDDVRALERELARTGKEAAGLAAIRALQKDGAQLKAPGDCTPLLTLLDDPTASDEEFAAKLVGGLTGSRGEPRTGPASAGGAPVLAAWIRLDKGEVPSPDEAIRRLDDR
jgi:hypothetical protein